MDKKMVSRVLGLIVVAAALVGCGKKDDWDIYGQNPAGVTGSSMDGSMGGGMNDGIAGYDFVGEPIDGAQLSGGEERAGMFSAVYFGYDSNAVQGGESAKLQEVAEYMNNENDVALIVEGHCDERGSREYNIALGERRALAVREYLIGLGVAADRIQTRSMGKEMPAVEGQGESAWAQNRRAEFIIYY